MNNNPNGLSLLKSGASIMWEWFALSACTAREIIEVKQLITGTHNNLTTSNKWFAVDEKPLTQEGYEAAIETVTDLHNIRFGEDSDG